MTKSNGAKRRTPIAPAPPDFRTALTPLECWYRDALIKLAKHHRRPASLAEIATHCVRSRGAVHAALQRMARKGRVRQNDAGHYEAIP